MEPQGVRYKPLRRMFYIPRAALRLYQQRCPDVDVLAEKKAAEAYLEKLHREGDGPRHSDGTPVRDMVQWFTRRVLWSQDQLDGHWDHEGDQIPYEERLRMNGPDFQVTDIGVPTTGTQAVNGNRRTARAMLALEEENRRRAEKMARAESAS